jgi:hypothetical protein
MWGILPDLIQLFMQLREMPKSFAAEFGVMSSGCKLLPRVCVVISISTSIHHL